MRSSDKSGKKPIEEMEEVQPHKAKLESVSRYAVKHSKAKEAPRDKKEVLQTILDNIPVMIAFLDPRGNHKLVNQAWQKTLGWSLKEAQSRDILKELYPDPKYYQYVVDFISKAELKWGDFKTRRRDGMILDTIWANVPLSDGSNIGIGLDLTERKEIEQQLKDAFNLNQVIIDASPVGIWMFEESGQFVMFNPSGVALSGGTAEQLLKLNFWELESWKRSGLVQAAEEALLTGKLVKKEIHTVNTFNAEVWYEALLSTIQFKGKKHLLLMTYDIKDRKHSEEALRETTQTLEAVVQASPLPIVALDRERIVKMWNPTAERTFGWSAKEIIGRQYPAIPKNKIDEADALFPRALESGLTEVETIRRRKDGSLIDVSISAAPLLDSRGNINGTMAVIADITERKRAEQKIEILAKFPSESPYPVLRVAQDGTILYTNQSGIPLLESRKSGVGQLAPQDWQLLVREVLQSGSVKRLEVRHASQVFAFRAVPIMDANYVNFYGVDITERKKAEEALRDSRNMLQTVLDSIPATVFWKDCDSIYLGGNRTFLEDAGIKSSEELVGKSDYDLPWEKEQADSFREDDRRVMESGFPEYGIIEHYLRSDGTHAWARTNKVPLRDTEGNVTGVLGTSEDITEQKKAEQKLLEYQEQLKFLASKLTLAEESERRRIAEGLHDQISQSLVSSKIELDALLHSVSPKDYSQALKEVSGSLGKAINDMRSLTFDLSFPILYELGFEAAVAAWLVDRVEDRYGIKTEFEEDGQPKPLDKDVRILLFRDVRELLINTIKHSHAKKVKVSIHKVGGEINVIIEDDGIGFDTKKAATTAVRKGGFGLFSIRERLEQLGGYLEIKSAPGCGTKATLVAPLKQEKEHRRGKNEH